GRHSCAPTSPSFASWPPGPSSSRRMADRTPPLRRCGGPWAAVRSAPSEPSWGDTRGKRWCNGSNASSERPLDKSPRLLIPIIRARSAPGLLDVAAAILRSERGSGHVLGVVEQPLGRPIAENLTVARRYRALLRRITGLERRVQVGLGVQVRVASTMAQGVREAA